MSSRAVTKEAIATLLDKLVEEIEEVVKIPRDINQQAKLALKLGLKAVSQMYANKVVWERQSSYVRSALQVDFYSRENERNLTREVIDKYMVSFYTRKTLLENQYGNITLKMAKNWKVWDAYMGGLMEAENQLAKMLIWLELLEEEWRKKETVFQEFWASVDHRSGEPLVGDKVIGLLYSIFVALPPRRAFIQSRISQMLSNYSCPRLDVQPEWLEWDVHAK